MTPSECAELLALAAAFDNRSIGEENARAWAAALEPTVTLGDARQIVVDHYASTRDWIMPADVNTASARLRRARLERADVVDPPDGLETPSFLAWRRAYQRAIGDGLAAGEADAVACAAVGVARARQVSAARPVLALVATAVEGMQVPPDEKSRPRKRAGQPRRNTR